MGRMILLLRCVLRFIFLDPFFPITTISSLRPIKPCRANAQLGSNISIRAHHTPSHQFAKVFKAVQSVGLREIIRL